MKTIKGCCLCKGVQFEIRGEVTPIQKCHAERCRKATGGAYAPELLVAKKDLIWKTGKELITDYTAPILNEPPAYKRSFCKRCGSPVPVEIEGSIFMMLLAGILDSDPETKAFRHAFTAQKASWHEITDTLPSFEGQPPVPDRYKNEF